MRRSYLPLFNMCGDELGQAGFRRQDVIRAYEELCGIFGEDWVEEQKRKPSGGITDYHPLLGAIGTGSTSSVLHALELAVALRVFGDRQELQPLVDQMRGWDSFDDAYYSLRIALRFHLLGFDVTLEPETPPGRADILATGRGLALGVECTNVRTRLSGRGLPDAFNAIVKRVEAEIPEEHAVELIVSAPLSKSVERTAGGLLTRLIREQGTEATSDDGVCRVKIRPLSTREKQLLARATAPTRRSRRDPPFDWSEQGPWSSIVVISEIPAHDPKDAATYDFQSERGKAIVKLRVPPEDPEDTRSPEDTIDKKVSSKISQVNRHPDEWISAVFLNVPYDVVNVDADRVWRRLAGSQFSQCDKLAAVAITRNYWVTPAKNRFWIGFLPNPAARTLFPDSVMLGIELLEERLQLAHLLRSTARHIEG